MDPVKSRSALFPRRKSCSSAVSRRRVEKCTGGTGGRGGLPANIRDCSAWPHQVHSEANIYFQTENEDSFRENFQKCH